MELHLEQFLLDTFLLQPFSKCAPRLALCNYFTVIGCRFRESLSQVLETISLILWRRYCQIKARRNLSQRGAEARVMSFDTGKPNIVLLLAASRTWPHFGFLKWKFRFYNFGMGAANNLTALKKKLNWRSKEQHCNRWASLAICLFERARPLHIHIHPFHIH